MDLRELFRDHEEAFRAGFDGLRKQLWHALPVIVAEDSPDGHSVKLQIALKARQLDQYGNLTHVEFPILQDVPIHHPQGGGVVHTYAHKKGDEGIVLFSNLAIDAWRQSGGVQQTIDTRTHSLSDGKYIPGIRSDPRKIKNVSTEAAHLRSDDGKHTVEQHPTNGTTIKTVDPSDSADNPFQDAQKFFASIFHPTNGIHHDATDSGNTHSVGVTHDAGAFMSALNKLHQVLAHPDLGALLSAANGQHLVQAHPDDGVKIQSAKALAIQAATSIEGGLTADTMSVPGGFGAAEGGAPLASGAASANVGNLSGDLGGTLPAPTVVGLTNVANANMLPIAGSDSAAASAGVHVGGLYINQTAITGQNLLCVRMA